MPLYIASISIVLEVPCLTYILNVDLRSLLVGTVPDTVTPVTPLPASPDTVKKQSFTPSRPPS